MTDIVERLRRDAVWYQRSFPTISALFAEAADEITRLRSEITRLTQERDKARETAKAHVAGFVKQCEAANAIAKERNEARARLTSLQAENERLKEALKPFAGLFIGVSMNDGAIAAYPVIGAGEDKTSVTAGDVRAARAALEPPTG